MGHGRPLDLTYMALGLPNSAALPSICLKDLELYLLLHYDLLSY